MKIRYSSVALLLLICCFHSGEAQSFSYDWATVPASYNGHNIKTVLNSLISSPVLKGKDEFETTAQYKARRSNVSAISLGNGLSASDLLVFKLDGSVIGGDLDSSYDADAGRLTITINARKLSYLALDAAGKFDKREFSGIRLSNIESQTDRVGIREVRKMRLYAIGINNYSSFNPQAGLLRESIKINLTLSPEKAKAAKTNLAALFVTKLTEPFNGLDLLQSKATLERLYDLEAATFYVVGDVSDIWLFNTQTGEIYHKLKSGK